MSDDIAPDTQTAVGQSDAARARDADVRASLVEARDALLACIDPNTGLHTLAIEGLEAEDGSAVEQQLVADTISYDARVLHHVPAGVMATLRDRWRDTEVRQLSRRLFAQAHPEYTPRQLDAFWRLMPLDGNGGRGDYLAAAVLELEDVGQPS